MSRRKGGSSKAVCISLYRKWLFFWKIVMCWQATKSSNYLCLTPGDLMLSVQQEQWLFTFSSLRAKTQNKKHHGYWGGEFRSPFFMEFLPARNMGRTDVTQDSGNASMDYCLYKVDLSGTKVGVINKVDLSGTNVGVINNKHCLYLIHLFYLPHSS